ELIAARSGTVAGHARGARFRQRVIAPLRALSANDLRELRAAYAADDIARGADSRTATEAKRGRAGRLEPPDLPGKLSSADLIARLDALETSRDGLPEEWLITGGYASIAPDVGPPITRAEATRPVARAPGIPATANWPMYHHDSQHTGVVTD